MDEAWSRPPPPGKQANDESDTAVAWDRSLNLRRLGVAVALLLDLAGVERAAIGVDFATSESNLRATFDEWLVTEADPAARLRLAEALSCRPTDVTGLLDYVDEVHGWTESYLVGC